MLMILLDHSKFQPFRASKYCLPKPTTNAYLMKSVRKPVGISFRIPLPKFVLEIAAAVIQTETKLIIKSRNVLSKKLIASGFQFKHPSSQNAIKKTI